MKQLSGRRCGGILLATFLAGQAALAAPLGMGRTPLSAGGQGWEAAAAIDAQGNSTAVWVDRAGTSTAKDRVWSKSHAPGQPWSARSVLSRPLPATPIAPVIRSTAAGAATAVWNEADGVWTAERPAQGAWGAARLLVAGAASPLFAMNAQGDSALAWGSGIGPGGPTQLNVMRRDAGGAWQAPQVVAQGPSVTFDHLAVADGSGEVLATWETYDAFCNTHCTLVDFVLHAARAARGSATWADSGPLDGPRTWSHDAQVALDPAGHAGIVYALDFQGVMSTTQPGMAMAWCAPALVYGSTFAYVVGLAADAGGNATLAFLDEGGTGQLVAIVGSLATNLWNAPVGVSMLDLSVGQAQLASSSTGAAILAWTSGDANFSHNVVRTSTRSASASSWRRPRTISSIGAEQPVPEAVAVNAAGQGLVVFSAFDSSLTTHTEYAVTN